MWRTFWAPRVFNLVNSTKPKLAVHKFSSCDGCQLALLNLGESLLELPKYVDITHFAEAGPNNPNAKVDIALVEGSISTPADVERIKQVRENSAYLIAIGACATAGGLQALANLADRDAWMAAVYAQPDAIETLGSSSSISEHVKVDLELHGCPVNSQQVIAALADLLAGVNPVIERQPLCMECKRKGVVCTMVTKGEPCMGLVTRAGCSALCPSLGRACYSCYGPAETVNDGALAQRLQSLGLTPEAVARRFLFITSATPPFRDAGLRLRQPPLETDE
ncbi:MAG: sulfhydrogenase subunit delta [gamma proteobacterium endosymbiont of Lamellibrachia anaximandri]|nr:sulfhydrogenase subunit delta [gamma proteobacterium endosymbiont of Lamellibrachia anaximandri]MBL3535568.1 sulfhydrogenase subunit delta [gamma proteobacterium endosymbiont of Lamellibrachia anaximandri]